MSQSMMSGGIPPDWAETLVSPDAFHEEQRHLGHVWTFLGLTFDLTNDGDWLTGTVGGRSVFVQRFGTELRGFENRCAHRFFPLRTGAKGNGPVICGFHGWQYDREGRAVGIPQCLEVFGTAPHGLGMKLARLEVATCGTMIFGRFAGPEPSTEPGETLQDFMGDGFSILEKLSRAERPPRHRTLPAKANWKLCIHASLDDYHLVNVHPKSLGKGGGIPVETVTYHRSGKTIAYINTVARLSFDEVATALKQGTFPAGDFSIFHVCPTTFLVVFHAHGPHTYCGIVHYEPVAHDRSVLHGWFYPAPFGASSGFARAWRRLSEPVRTPIVSHITLGVFREDHRVCEGLQRNAASVDRAPMLGALETRIGWFEEMYRSLIERGRKGFRALAS